MILITGGMGFIGLHTARRFLDMGEDVVITYFQTWREPSFIKDEFGKRVQVEKVDVTDGAALTEVVKKHKVDGIVDLVAPGLGKLPPGEDLWVNTAGLHAILEAAREGQVKRVTLASSLVVYFNCPEDGPWREDLKLPIESPNPTATWKKAWEIMGLHYAERAELDLICVRIGGFWGPLYHSMSSLNSRMANAAARGEELDLNPEAGIRAGFAHAGGGVPFEDDGMDLCYVKDGARAIQMLHMSDSLNHKIYNIGGGGSRSNKDLLTAVQKAAPGFSVELQKGKGPMYKANNYMDMSRIKNDVGFVPEYTVETGMADYIAWLKEGNER